MLIRGKKKVEKHASRRLGWVGPQKKKKKQAGSGWAKTGGFESS